MRIFALTFVLLCAAACLLANPIVSLESNYWNLPQNGQLKDGIIVIESQQPVQSSMARYRLPVQQMQGCLAELTGEYKTTGLEKDGQHPHGGKINVFFLCGNGVRKYFSMSLPTGTNDWQPFRLVYTSPESPAKQAEIQLGLQMGRGKVEYRNLKINVLGTSVPLGDTANMEWCDSIAGDGCGGWTDAGPQEDGRYLLKAVQNKLLFSGYPFELKTSGKSVLVMNQAQYFPAGPKQASIRPLVPVRAKWLYLLHTSSWMSKQTGFGEILICYDNGATQKILLSNTIDLADWTHGTQLPNGKIAVLAKSETQPLVALYASRFLLKSENGNVSSITFSVLPNAPIWLIAGITLSDSDFVAPNSDFVVRQGDFWKEISRECNNRRIHGSALDLNAFRDDAPCGTYGRVVISPEGHFVFENRPKKRIRFFTNTIAIGYLSNHDEIDAYVDELCKNGFNMVRFHYLDLALCKKAKKEGTFDPEMLDAFDYLVSRCKAKGIYLNLDCMTSTIGYSPGEVWGRENIISNKGRIYFESQIRQQWINGVRQILCRTNRYTGTRLVDDPVLAMAVGYNEQEFGFFRTQSEAALPAWQDFLERRYSNMENLKHTWGKRAYDYTSFRDIPLYTPSIKSLETDPDFAAFVLEKEQEIMRFYRGELNKMGFRGPLSGFNLLGNKHSLLLRKEFEYVSKNSYEMLMNMYFKPGSVLSQESSISSFDKMLRVSLGARLADKPFFMTEYGIPFWNRYRYEAAFTMGAYAAFQDFDGLAAFGDSYAYASVKRISPVRIYTDPIGVATEFLTFFLYMREDVRPAKNCVVLQFPEEEIIEKGDRSSPAFEEGIYGLMTRVCWFLPKKEETWEKDGMVVNARHGTLSQVFAMHTSVADVKSADAENPAFVLRENHFLPPDNRSDGYNRFESDTQELFLIANQKFMQVNTPRFQGICAEGGTNIELQDFTVLKMEKRGNMSLVAIDGMNPIFKAERMVLVYATNALNNEMAFDSVEMRMLVNQGNAPALLETAAFKIQIRNQNAANLKLFPLDMKGSRLREILPSKVFGNCAEFEVDTSKDGVTIFFEITSRQTNG